MTNQTRWTQWRNRNAECVEDSTSNEPKRKEQRMSSGITDKTPTTQPDRCPLCKGSKTVHVLGCGGDYEYQPCPRCQPQPPDYTYDPDNAD